MISAAAYKETDPELKAFLEYMNGIMCDRPFIRKIDRYIKELKENEERRQEYMLLNLVEMDARKDGIQQGIQQGLQQGKSLGLIEGKIETARNLLSMGLSLDDIIKATGLSKQEIDHL